MKTIRDFFTPEEWQQLEKRAERVAHVADSQDEHNYVPLLVVSINEERYGIRGQYVQAVHDDIVILPLPGVPQHIAGIANIRGNLATILSLRHLLEHPTQTNDVDTPSILLEVAGTGRTHLALQVDAVITMQDVIFENMMSVSTGDTHTDYTLGFFNDGTILIDIDAIINDPILVVNQTQTTQLEEI